MVIIFWCIGIWKWSPTQVILYFWDVMWISHGQQHSHLSNPNSQEFEFYRHSWRETWVFVWQWSRTTKISAARCISARAIFFLLSFFLYFISIYWRNLCFAFLCSSILVLSHLQLPRTLLWKLLALLCARLLRPGVASEMWFPLNHSVLRSFFSYFFSCIWTTEQHAPFNYAEVINQTKYYLKWNFPQELVRWLFFHKLHLRFYSFTAGDCKHLKRRALREVKVNQTAFMTVTGKSNSSLTDWPFVFWFFLRSMH